jgi:hypothetical protein
VKRAPAALALLACACIHKHLERDAPGSVDVMTPPKDLARKQVELPDDPGERMVVASVGPFAGGGFAIDPGGARGAWALGLEGSVFYGERDNSHMEDSFFTYPRESGGVNFGWHPLRARGSGLFAAYAEAQYGKDGLGVAAGWVTDGPGLQGAQLTVFGGPVFARARVFPGLGADFQFGVFVKLPYVWVWSR